MIRSVILAALILTVLSDGSFTFQCFTSHPSCPSTSAFVFVGSESEKVICTGSKRCPSISNYTMDCSVGDTTKVECSTTDDYCASGNPHYSITSEVGSGFHGLYFCLDGPCVTAKVEDLCGASYFWVIVAVVVGVVVIGVIAGVLFLRWKKKKEQEKIAEAYRKMPDPNTDTIITHQ